MNAPEIVLAVIGKGFGDEGKGLAVDYFCSLSPDSLVIKHNGGAQAGHTVERDGNRFVFHQLSSGSFLHADTFWADTYFPDLYKLREEMDEFKGQAGFYPKIYVDAATPVTLVDDVLLNMFFEARRGEKRHGSCGMGINEAYLRTKAGYGMTVSDFLSKDTDELLDRYQEIRENYLWNRLEEGMKEEEQGSHSREQYKYLRMMGLRAVAENAIERMQRNANDFVRLSTNTEQLLGQRHSVIFENGQGLLLDSEYQEFAPHLTTSRTGLANPIAFAKRFHMELTEVAYITRTYVTRHGAGPLPQEHTREELRICDVDQTNLENPWQGKLRYAKHGTTDEFLKPVLEDLATHAENQRMKIPRVSLFLTHINETKNRILMKDGDVELESFLQNEKMRRVFNGYYLSSSRESGDTIRVN